MTSLLYEGHADSAQLFQVPYLLAMLPLATDDVLVASVQCRHHRTELVVQRLGDGGCEDVFVSSRLGSVSLQKSVDRFAVISPSEVLVFERHGQTQAARLPLSGVSAAGFDANGDLWLQRERSLYKALTDNITELVRVSRQIAAFTLTAQSCLRGEIDDAGNIDLVLVDQDGEACRFNTGIAVDDLRRQYLDLCLSGDVVHLMLQPRFHTGHQNSVVHRFNLSRAATLPSVDLPAICHLGLRKLKMRPWHDGALLILAEAQDEMALCLLQPHDTTLQVLSSPGIEVLDFCADPDARTVAYLGISMTQPPRARSLTVLQGFGSSLQLVKSYTDSASVFGMIDGQAVLLQRTEQGFNLRSDAGGPTKEIMFYRNEGRRRLSLWIVSADGGWAFRDTPNAVDLSSAKPSPEGEGWVRGNQNKEKAYFIPPHPSLLPQGEGAYVLKSTALRDTPPSRRPLLVFLPGLHKLPTQELQSNFLQEFIVRLLARQQGRLIDACMLQLPGSAGRGRDYRCKPDFYDLDGMAEQICLAIEGLAREGYGPIGLVSASLGTLGLLRALAHIDVETACALINPVYNLAAVVGSALAPEEHPSRLNTGRCEVLVVHGNRDEVTPYRQSLEFTCGPLAARRRLLTIEGEGHIFSSWLSWQRTADEICRFFETTLLPDSKVTEAEQ
ncbi:alpha/beta hydrolase [Methylobacter sp.]|jgi:hypothetical protein|uniref:alpha/beta hydrolase n=1 Tax=Methylobacter sp. TaxID=2051955 RepID=UPI003DA32950